MKITKSYPKTMRGLALILSLIMVLTSCDLSAVGVMASPLDAEAEDILADNTSDESVSEDQGSGDDYTAEDYKATDATTGNASKEESGALIPETEAEPEETPASDKDNSVTENKVPFAKSVTVDDVVVTVMADEGVFPADSQLFVKRVTDRNTQKKINEAVEKEHETGIRVAASYTFDIKVLDKVGNEIEPDNRAGKVQLSFATAEVSNENLTADIYHIKTEEESSASDDADKSREAHGEINSSDAYEAERLDSATLSTEELNKQADEIVESLQNSQENGAAGQTRDGADVSTKEELAANDATEAVQAETDGFSYYTVEFTYGEKQYVMEGDTEVLLQDVLDYVGIYGTVTNAYGSNDELFSAENRDGTWYLVAHEAFSSQEWLKVTLDGVEMDVEIVVTDQIWESLTQNPPTVVSNGDTIKKDGYTITLDYLVTVDTGSTNKGSNSGTGSVTVDSSKASGYSDVSKWLYITGIQSLKNKTWNIKLCPGYVLHFDTKGGTGVTETVNYGSGGASITFETPTRSGHSFLGWKRRGSSGGYETSFSATGKGGDVYFDAEWAPPATAPTLSDYNEPYDGEAHTIGSSGGTGGTVQYSEDGVNWASTAPYLTDVGTKTVYARTKGDSTHMDSSVVSATITITSKEVGLSWTDDTFTYDGNSHKPIATATGLISGDSCTVTVSGEKTDAGTYTATASELSNNNYKLPSKKTHEFTISKCPTEITITASDMIYTGQELKPTPTVKALANNNATVNPSEYTVSYSNNTNSGTATVTVTNKDNGNYIITENSQNFTVIPKKLDNSDATGVTVAEIADQTYSGEEITPDISITYNGINLMERRDFDVSYADHVNAGTATVTLTGKGNYQGTKTVSFTIAPLSFNTGAENFALKISGNEFTYSGSPKVPVESLTRGGTTLIKDRDYEVTFKNSNTAVRATADFGPASTHAVDAGTVTLRVTGKGNYKDHLEITYTIIPMEVEVYGLTATDREYDGTKVVQINTGSATLHGYVQGDELSIATARTGEMDDAKAGTGKTVNLATVTLSGKHASDYYLTSVDPVRVNITKRALTEDMFSFIAGNGVSVDGSGNASVVYNSEAQTPALTLTDMNGSINMLSDSDVSVSYNNNVHAGKAVITVTATDSGNYSGTVTKSFTINKAPVTITANSGTSAYGAAINYSDNEYTVSGTIYDADKDDLSVKAVTSVKAGYAPRTYTGANTISYNRSNTDYEITTVAADYTVTPADNTGESKVITVTKSDYAGIYDGAAHTFGISARGILPEDVVTIYYDDEELSGSNYSTAGTTDKPSYTDAGTYNVYYYAVSPNYNGGTAGFATITINPAPLSVSVDDAVTHEITYGGTVSSLSGTGLTGLTVTGFVDADTTKVSNWNGAVSYTSPYEQYGNVGEYLITPVIADASTDALFKNYAITYHAGKMTVKPKAVTFTWSKAGENAYTGHEIYNTATVTGLLNGDDVSAGGYKTTGTVTVGNVERQYAFYAIDNGNYRSEVTKLEGAKAANYCIADNDSTVVSDWSITGGTTPVTPNHTITVTAVPEGTISYGDPVSSSNFICTYKLDGSDVATDFNIADYTDGTLSYSTDYKVGDPVGSYNVTPYGLSGKTVGDVSYSVEYVSGSFTVTKATNEITGLSIADWYYGDAASEPKATARFGEVSFKYQEAKQGITDWGIFNWKTTEIPTQAGTYRIYAYVEGTDDYAGFETSKDDAVTFEIKKAEVTITLNDKTSVYGKDLELLGYSKTVARGKLSESDDAWLNNNIAVYTQANQSKPAGKYPITAEVPSNDNMNVTIADAVYTITKETIHVSDGAGADGSVSCTYDGQPHGINVPDLVDSGDQRLYGDYTIYYSTSSLNAGNYGSGSTVSPTVTDAEDTPIYYYIKSDCYSDLAGRATVSIAKADLTVTAVDSEIPFGSDPANNGVTYSGFVGNDDENCLGGTLTYDYYAYTGDNIDTNKPYVKGSSSGKAGTYAIVPKGLTSGNYNITFEAGYMTVTEGQLAPSMFVAIDPVEITFDETGNVNPVRPGVAVNSEFAAFVNSDDFTADYEDNDSAGTGKVIISPNPNGNYANSDSVEITFTITPKRVSITAGNAESVYNADLADIGYTVTSGTLNEAEKTALNIKTETTARRGSVAGTYETSVSYRKNNNYDITVTKGTYTVTPATLTVKAEGINVVYDGNSHSLGTVTAKTGKLFDLATVYYSTVSTDDASAKAHSENETVRNAAKAVPYGIIAGDYTVYYCAVCTSYEDVTGSFNAKITKAPLTATVSYSGNIIYGAEVPDYSSGTISYTGFKGTDDSTVITGIPVYTSSYTQRSDAGNYELTVSGISADNYSITVVPGILVVTPKTVSFTWPSESEFAYTGSEIAYTATIDPSSLIEGDSGKVLIGGYAETGETFFETIAYNHAYKAIDVGTYLSKVASLSGSKAGNYAIDPDTQSHQWKIAEGSAGDVSAYPILTVTPSHTDIYYGDDVSADGYSYTAVLTTNPGTQTESTEIIDASGLSAYLESPSAIQYMTNCAKGSDVGTYDIEAYGLAPKTEVNVRIVYAKGTLTVKKASSEAGHGTPNAFTGGAVPDGNGKSDLGMGDGWTYGSTPKEPTVTTSLGGIPEYTYYSKDDQGNYTELSGKPTTPGSYAVTATVPGNDNYDAITSGYDDFAISKAQLYIVASDMSSSCGEEIKTLEYTVSGKVGNDEIVVNLTTTADLSVVGDYPITLDSVSGVAVSNYNVSFTPGTYSVTKAGTVSVTASGVEVTYDKQPHGISVAVQDNDTEVYYSENELNANNYKTGSREPITYINAREYRTYYYAVSPTKEGVGGYQTVKINKKEVTVTPENQTITYGETIPSSNVMTYVGFVSGDTVSELGISVTASYSYSQYGNAGNYNITPVLDDTTNYTFTKNTGTLTVTPKPLTFSWSKDAFFYDGEEKTITATATNKARTEDEIGFSYEENEKTEVGNYTAKITGLAGTAAANYSIDEATSTHPWKIVAGENSFTGKPAINSWTYGQTPSVPYAESRYGTATFEYSDSENGTYSGTQPSLPGTYYMKAKVEASDSYGGLESEPVEFTIRKALLSFAADDQFGSEGAELKTLTYVTKGTVVSGDSVEPVLTTTATASSAQGSYPITINAVKVNGTSYEVTSGTANTPLYVISVTGATYHISGFGVNVKRVDESGNEFSDFAYTYDGKGYGIKVSLTGNPPEGATVYYSTRHYDNYEDLNSAISLGRAGTITPFIKTGGVKVIYYYVVAGSTLHISGTATFNISKAPLTVKANDVMVIQGNDLQGNGVSCSGFKGNDDISVLGGILTYTSDYQNSDPEGTYTITPAGLFSDRYDITFLSGVVNCVRLRDISSPENTPIVQNPTYTGSPVSPVIKVGNATLVLGTDFELVNGSLSKTTAGSYSAVIRGKGAYTGEATINWAVTKKPTPAPKAGEGYTQTTNNDGKVVVTPKEGYSIWKIDGNSMVPLAQGTAVEPGTELYVRKNETSENAASGYTAFIAEADPQVAVTIISSPSGKGTVILKIGGTTKLTTTSETFRTVSSGTVAILKAEPANGFNFVKWTKAVGSSAAADAGTGSEKEITITESVTYTAVFVYVPEMGEEIILDSVIPSAITDNSKPSYPYDGSGKGLGLSDNAYYTVSGDISEVTPGTYTTILTPKDGKIWPDGTTGPKEIKWAIEPKETTYKPTAAYYSTTGKITLNTTGAGTYADGGEYVYEYQKEGEDTWHTITGNEFTAEDASVYSIRVKGTEHDSPGPAAVIKVGSPVRVYSNPPTNIGSTEATLTGYADNAQPGDEAGFYISTDPSTDPASWTWIPGTVGLDGTVTSTATGLSPDTTYYYYPVVRKGDKDVIGDVMSFRTQPSSVPFTTGKIKIEVSAADGSSQYPYSITVELGNDIIASASGITGSTAAASFEHLPDGNYNVVVRRTDGVDFAETKTITITNGKTAKAVFVITAGEVSTLVKVEPGAPKVAVSGLPEMLTQDELEKAASGEQSTEINFNVEKVSENNADGSAELLGIMGDDMQADMYLDLSLYKTTSQLDGQGNVTSSKTEDIGSTNNVVMEIAIPYENTEVENLTVYRYHDGVAEELVRLESRQSSGNYIDGTFAVDGSYIYIYASGFSTYMIGHKKTTGGGGGGGGTTPEPADAPVITQPEHGTITVNPESPKAGQDAVVTVTPEEGYETENIIVKDNDGNTVPVTKNDDGTYTFTQPATGPVTIEAVVKQATDLTPVIKNPEHGTISVNPAKPRAGETVIVTVTPDEGYEVDSFIVTDKEGKPVAFTLNADGTYSFVQPASGCVTIEAVLRLKGGVIVRFDLNDKTGTEPDPQTFIKGGKAVRPNDPAAEGYTFTGWFTDKECTKLYDFDTPVEEDIILYAGWEKTGPGPDDDDFGIYFAELFDNPYEGVHYNADYNDGEGRYEIVYTGAPIKPLIRVTSKADGVLKEGIDYSVSYSNNKNYSKKKPATIRVSGKGFYKSKKVLELYILQADLEEAQTRGLIAGADELKTLSGKKLNPVIVYRGYKLKGKDRNISNKSKITGDTTTDIIGRGNFSGTLKDVPVKVIGKDEQKKGAIKVKLKAGQHVYNGEIHKLSVTTAEAAGELTVTAGSSKTPLTEDTDFVISYSGNIMAGKATVTITGIGACNGTVVKKFTIKPDKSTDITADLAEHDEPVYFNVRGAKPDITVTAHRKAEGDTVTDVALKEGKDYKVSYSSNKKVGDGAYTVKFLGNYKGHKSVKGSFKIVQAPIDNAKVEAAQLIYKKPGKYLPKPYVSIDGVQLKKSDYTYKYYLGEKEITPKYKFSLADDETSKTVKIVVLGKGNYTNSTAEGTYEVVRRVTGAVDLTKAKIVAKDKNRKGKDVKVSKKEYTGYAIEPEIRVMVKINKKWTDVDPSLYTVSYINNVNKGKATILVTGDGEKTIGSKTARFSINSMRFELFKLIFGR